VPEDVISGYETKTVDGKEVFVSTFKTPDIIPILSVATPCIYDLAVP
jgi:hypothetical protein